MKPLVTALAAMTVACPDPRAFEALLSDVWGWERLADGPIDAVLELLWGIAPGSAGKRYAVMRSPGMNRGMIRIVSGPERNRQCQRAARWGGFEIVVMHDIDDIYATMAARADCAPFGPPRDYDFTHVQSNIHRAFSIGLPGGTHVTLTMPVTQPKDREFPRAPSQVGHIFEVPVTTPDYPCCRGFYENTLGMIPVLESGSTDGPMHAAWNIPPGPEYRLDILKGDAPGAGLGSIEVHGIDAPYIDPDPIDPKCFDGGACMATLTTTDVDTVYKALDASPDATIVSPPTTVAAAPYNGARVFVCRGPDGEPLEICEAMWA